MDYRKLDALAKEGTGAIGERLAELMSQRESVETRKKKRYSIYGPHSSKIEVQKRSKGVRRGIRRLLAAKTKAEHREGNIAAKTGIGHKTRDRRYRLREERESTRDGEVVDIVDRKDPELPVLEIVIYQPYPGATINHIIKVSKRDSWNSRFGYLESDLNHRYFKSPGEARDACNEVIDSVERYQ